MSQSKIEPAPDAATSAVADWNVVATVRRGGFKDACRFLEQFGTVQRTVFYNVLVMRVADVHDFLERVHAWANTCEDVRTFLAGVVPVTHTFTFRTPEEFEHGAAETALTWVPNLVGRKFHVRMHRRGASEQLASGEEEEFLATVLLDVLADQDVEGHVTFKDPDAIIAVETVGDRAGLSFWTREDLERYPLLRVD